jgi:hypothetical protein
MRGEHHVPAVRAAVDDGAVWVDLGARGKPGVERRKIADGVEPEPDVVEMLEPLPVAGRPADIRGGDRIPARDEELRERAGNGPSPPGSKRKTGISSPSKLVKRCNVGSAPSIGPSPVRRRSSPESRS